jgi:pimeloyl-ACP methyl ester carboxylesterase
VRSVDARRLRRPPGFSASTLASNSPPAGVPARARASSIGRFAERSTCSRFTGLNASQPLKPECRRFDSARRHGDGPPDSASDARPRDVAVGDGVDAVYEALIHEVMGRGRLRLVSGGLPAGADTEWTRASGRAPLRRRANARAAAFAEIRVPTLLVTASDSPPEQCDVTQRWPRSLPNARLLQVGGGHL